jgi:branched-chain amino acid transport system permease protein
VELIVGTITNVVISSSMYILVALGLAFVFNMLGLLNLAHGAIYMMGGYICYEFAARLGFNSWAALLITTAILSLFGVSIEKYCFRPFVGNFNAAVTICVALTVFLQTIVNILIGTAQVSTPTFAQGVFKRGLISVSYERIATSAVGVVLVVLVLWFVNKTKWGQQMQAIAQNREAAYLQGINVRRVSALACAMGCGLAAVAGSLMGAFLNLNPFMGDFMLVKALVLVILGGLGSIGGVVIAGLVLGGVGAILPVVIDPLTADAITIGVIVVLLLFRPQGFFGREVET